MSEWKETKISELCDIRRGASPRPIQDYLSNKGIPWVKISDATASNSRFIFETRRFIIPEGKNASVSVKKGDLILSNSATPGLPKFMNIEACIHDGWLLLRNFRNASKEFFYYLLINERNKLISQASGTVFKNLTTDILRNHIVKLPSLHKQREIVSILSSFDNKIELLQKQNKILENIAQTLFKRWFVDFEFPNEQGKPYKSSGGKMIPSELGPIPEGWTIEKLGNAIENFDSKRIPLSSRERGKREGVFPYYGATKIMDYVDDYIFEGTYLLIAEDGSVADGAGFPVLQYVWGEFWVNNHAHVIQGKELSTEYIYLFFSKMIITPYITGAVQPKLNQTSMNSIKIVVPPKKITKEIDMIIKNLFNKKKKIYEDINIINELKCQNLPKLISGSLKLN